MGIRITTRMRPETVDRVITDVGWLTQVDQSVPVRADTGATRVGDVYLVHVADRGRR